MIEIPYTHTENFIAFLQDNSKNIVSCISLTTFFLTIVISFRVNQAYLRWWEARTLWGAMTNDTRDLSLKALTHVDDAGLAIRICLWTAVAADMLRIHLRGWKQEMGLLGKVVDSGSDAIRPDEFLEIKRANHKVLVIFWKLARLLKRAREDGALAPLIHMHMNEHIKGFNNHMGGMERILRCPMPIGYTCVIRTAIVCWMAVLPLGLMPIFWYAAIPIDIVVTYFVCGLEETAAELENPFGVDPNDLPLEHFTSNIRNNIFELMSNYEECQFGERKPRAGGRGGGMEGKDAQRAADDFLTRRAQRQYPAAAAPGDEDENLFEPRREE